MKIAILLSVTLFCIMLNTYANTGKIPLDDRRLPSIDLIHPELGLLDPEYAKQLKKNKRNPLDLSKLNPEENDVWKNTKPTSLKNSDDRIDVNQKTKFEFMGKISSKSETFRFSAKVKNSSVSQVYQFLMHKNVHPYLLKKNILRKLGYTVPAMKYLKEIELEFPSLERLNEFLERDIPENTLGAPARWISKENLEKSKQNLILKLHDIIIMSPDRKDHYNLALASPPERLSSRTLRSLILPYSLVHFNESANKVSWNLGQVKNKEILLSHDELSNFNATMDDAIWMARRLEKLTIFDFEQIVMNAYYPREVAKLLTQKLISRRNYLLELFLPEVQKLSFDDSPNLLPDLKDGKLIKSTHDKYASNFVHGIPDSPFKDYQYYLFSKIQSEIFTNLISKANSTLKVFDIADGRVDYYKNIFQNGLDHFIKTGEFQEIGIGTWWMPTINGKVILSRNIVMGNSFGTDNLIQTADTIGVSVSLGAYLGVEGVLQGSQLFVSGNTTLVRTYTHLKPLKNLKQSIKEPYKNLLIPLLMYRVGKKFKALSDEDSNDVELKSMMKYISKSLGVGESYIITDKFMGNVLAKMKYSFYSAVSAGVGIGGDGQILRRIQIYRKSKKIIQVYDDIGKKRSFSLNFELDALIPIINLGYKNTKGKYSVKVTSLSLDDDLNENPLFYQNALALSQLFKTGSTELINHNKSYLLKNSFDDDSTNLSFLFFKRKYLDTNSHFSLKTHTGHVSNYLYLSDGVQKGKNYEAFTREIIGYYISKLFAGGRVSVPKWKNPAHTLYGDSTTLMANYQSKFSNDETKIMNQYVMIENKKEGFQIKVKNLIKDIEKINKKYGKVIFPKDILKDTKKLMLFEMSVKIHFYKKALEIVKKLKSSDFITIQQKYITEKKVLYRCQKQGYSNLKFKGRKRKKNETRQCGYLNYLRRVITKCAATFNKENAFKKHGQCYMKIIKRLVEDLKIEDLLTIIGEDNLYLEGRINGFRLKSETLMQPIYANTIGRIGSRFKDGPVEYLRKLLDYQNGEFYGTWIRESLR